LVGNADVYAAIDTGTKSNKAMTGPKYARFSKEVKIDAQTSQVRSIRNKKL